MPWLLHLVFRAIFLLILARVLFSWVRPTGIDPVVGFVNRATEPILRPARIAYEGILGMVGVDRSKLPPVDFSPILALVTLSLLESILL